jgi:hypothetical protein
VIPKWDTGKIKDQGDAFLLESIAFDDPVRSTMEKALRTGQIDFAQLNFSNDQLIAICDKRAAMRAAQLEQGLKPTVGRCPESNDTLGALKQYLFRSRDSVYGEHLKMIDDTLTKSKLTDRPFKVFVYSHTHRADPGFRPLSNTEWNPIVVNTGAWQRVITTEQLERYIEQHKLGAVEVLPKISPEKLPECYSAIIVKPYSDTPEPILQYWTKDKDWELSSKCNDIPKD